MGVASFLEYQDVPLRKRHPLCIKYCQTHIANIIKNTFIGVLNLEVRAMPWNDLC